MHASKQLPSRVRERERKPEVLMISGARGSGRIEKTVFFLIQHDTLLILRSTNTAMDKYDRTTEFSKIGKISTYQNTRLFIYKHQQLLTELGWCLFSNRFCPHFHPTPTPIYVLKNAPCWKSCMYKWLDHWRIDRNTDFLKKNWAKFQAGGAYSGVAYK